MKNDWTRPRVLRAVLGSAALVVWASACIDPPAAPVTPRTESAVNVQISNNAIDKVDLLLEVDNSGSMAVNQQHLSDQLAPLIDQLVNPPDTNGDGMPDHPPVHDLHVGVISQDLGSAGLPVCNGPHGDDGLLNPYLNGTAEQTEVQALAMRGMTVAGRDGCADGNTYPAFLAFGSGVTDPTTFAHDFRCNAVLGAAGCGIEQQLEGVYRALITHRNDGPNAGFLRDDALLAIVLLTDEEDGSVRDCAYAEPGDTSCTSALNVFETSGDANALYPEAGADLNLRMYAYHYGDYAPAAGHSPDPTWPLERYVDPHNLGRGFYQLKPNHPELVVFAAIAGVPATLPTRALADGTTQTDWDALLGAPGADRDDFATRGAATAWSGATADGRPLSMTQDRVDTTCGVTHSGGSRVVPVCERITGAPTDRCSNNDDGAGNSYYFAWPSRRITEIARRFDEDPLCNGAPCHNGLVTSACNDSYADAMQQVVAKIQAQLQAPCLPRPLAVSTNAMTGQTTVQCLVRETLAVGMSCADAPGTTPVRDTTGNPEVFNDAQGAHALCDLGQVPTDTSGNVVPGAGEGWFYQSVQNNASCHQRVQFTPNAQPPNGANVELECIQAVNAPSTGPTGG